MKLTFDIDDIGSFLKELEDDRVVEAGVAVVGPAAAYAEVWEWGNARQTKKGPRTVLGTNPRGERVWLSSQAPYGYIWRNESVFWDSIRQQLEKVSFSGPTKREITSELVKATAAASEEMVKTVSDSAPVDTGQLSESFVAVKDGEPLLEDDGDLESRFRR